ncbi:MAG: peptide-methionine (S)-S-oxide reductase MsrA [Methanomicrobiaceae archaeon]|nr:peptide-methionine (S)-S-oxide reductase MsrA [Methanomicrobiaceae archaeon]
MHEKATFGAGCFWGVEAAFRRVEGVVETRVGYMGGTKDEPTYPEVCTGRTGHAEVVEVAYDPERVSYEALLEIFWQIHDPTTRDRQGPDVGSQYRSVIFTHSPEQERAARASKERLERSGRLRRPVVTEIRPAGTFWPAEEYHQKFFEKQGRRF